jgi:Lrp/AsnC family leucine-responsive transcriptional regulator
MESLDRTDWRILEALQRNGRCSYAELARAVAMSPSAVAERVRRLEESGVVTGYTAVVDPERVGLEEVTGRIGGLGPVTTSVVYSSPLARRALTQAEPTPGP